MASQGIISVVAKPSKFAAALAVAFMVLSLSLLSQANILLGYKLVLLVAIAIFVGMAGYSQLFTTWQKIDLLSYENKVVVWKNEHLPLVAGLEGITAFGNLLITLKLKLHNKSWRINLYYDSLNQPDFKQLMRLTRWQR